CVEEWEAFEDLADRLLPPGDAAPLDALRLRGVSCVDFRAARRWIRRGLRRRPVAFHLTCDNDAPHALSEHGWPCFPGITLRSHAGAFACRLRTMRLSGVSLSDDFTDCLAADFVVLEHLHLEGCTYNFGRLASHSLRELFIDRCRREYHQVNDVLAIAAPRIAYHSINGHPPPVTAEGEMPALIAASLADPAGKLGLLRSLRHARSLDLSGFSATALLGGEDAGDFPVFHNLGTLLLDGCDVGVECQVLRRFLRNAPSLETLTLRDCAFTGDSRSKKRKARSRDKTPSSDCCSPTAYECKNLKSIELEFREGHAVDELAQALVGILKEEARPMESSVQDGKRRVKISYT
uniref:FBD domain-containing protein n=1 Tax=Setaria italica TaxID=4555 RepID=K3YDF6_SETIT